MFHIHESSLRLMYLKHDIPPPPPLLGLHTYSEADKFFDLLTEDEVSHISDT